MRDTVSVSDVSLSFEGHLDSLTRTEVRGWAADGFDPAHVVVTVNGEVVGSCCGGVYRPDLVSIDRSPESGFLFRFPTPLATGDVVGLSTRTGQGLENSPAVFDSDVGDAHSPHGEDIARNPILFLHIPKTAGTSLRTLVHDARTDAIFIYNGQMESFSFIQAMRSRSLPKLIYGHFSCGAHNLIKSRPRYASVIRHPVDRIISLFTHKFTSGSEEVRDLPYTNEGLRKFVLEIAAEQANNHSCRIISGIAGDHGTLIKDHWLYDFAVHNIERHFDHIVVFEEILGCVDYLTRELDLPEKSISKMNVSRIDKLIVDDDTKSLIENHNMLDILLYNYIKSR